MGIEDNLPDALRRFEEALAFCLSNDFANSNPSQVVKILDSIGQIHLLMDKREIAMEVFSQAKKTNILFGMPANNCLSRESLAALGNEFPLSQQMKWKQ